ncbi:hypothetical protein [Paenibacillus sp. tmac-D7]|uniref:hypothetical protein n=1 Tax=Paenibacillus sp. tmac-D7 TaxID=2591462 RepID=UPI001142DD35|nr:hypothetical protein [Paenibacillus sp. tmac-D7]
MQLSNCSGCGKLQTGRFETLCTDCLKKHIEVSHQIKHYLQLHPGASLIDICQHTGLPLSMVNEIIKRV